MQKYYGFTAENGIPFIARRVDKGDRYGMDYCLVHDETRAMIEFYDCRHAHGPCGQFVSRYYWDTLENRNAVEGLCLDGGHPEIWAVDWRSLQGVRKALCYPAKNPETGAFE